MNSITRFVALLALPALIGLSQAQENLVLLRQESANPLGLITARMMPANEDLSAAVLTDTPHINRATTKVDGKVYALEIAVDPETNQISLLPPKLPRPQPALEITLETGSSTQQFNDGRILLAAKDAEIVGDTAQLESHPGNHRIGFWSKEKDSVQWNYKASRPGRYQLALTYSKAAGDGTRIRIQAADSLLTTTLEPTGSWYRYRSVELGPVYLPKSGDTTVTVRCLKLTGGAVMNLKALTLTPTGEGNPIVQQVDGAITLHASDATIHGTKLQYERFPHKNTVGYWVNESDWVYWDFSANRPGKFAIEILQGCGRGHGGSDVEIVLGDQVVPFQVEETGHFQNFVPRYVGQLNLGRPDTYRLAVKPVKKAAGAVMDLRRIRLIPVLDNPKR